MSDTTSLSAWMVPAVVFTIWSIASTQGSSAIVVITPVAHAIWITLDCRRRRRHDTAGWTLAAAVSGPLAAIIYLALEYRRRALLWVPLYLLALVTPVQIALYMHQRWFGGPF